MFVAAVHFNNPAIHQEYSSWFYWDPYLSTFRSIRLLPLSQLSAHPQQQNTGTYTPRYHKAFH